MTAMNSVVHNPDLLFPIFEGLTPIENARTAVVCRAWAGKTGHGGAKLVRQRQKSADKIEALFWPQGIGKAFEQCRLSLSRTPLHRWGPTPWEHKSSYTYNNIDAPQIFTRNVWVGQNSLLIRLKDESESQRRVILSIGTATPVMKEGEIVSKGFSVSTHVYKEDCEENVNKKWSPEAVGLIQRDERVAKVIELSREVNVNILEGNQSATPEQIELAQSSATNYFQRELRLLLQKTSYVFMDSLFKIKASAADEFSRLLQSKLKESPAEVEKLLTDLFTGQYPQLKLDDSRLYGVRPSYTQFSGRLRWASVLEKGLSRITQTVSEKIKKPLRSMFDQGTQAVSSLIFRRDPDSSSSSSSSSHSMPPPASSSRSTIDPLSIPLPEDDEKESVDPSGSSAESTAMEIEEAPPRTLT